MSSPQKPGEGSPSTTPKKRAAASKKSKRPPKKTKLERILDSPTALLQDPDSPLFQETTNIKALLQHPLAVAFLTADENDYYPFFDIPSEDFARAIGAFQEDGSCGRYDPEWIEQALDASARRRAGEFDDFLEKRFKEEWGDPDEDVKAASSETDAEGSGLKSEDAADNSKDDSCIPDAK